MRGTTGGLSALLAVLAVLAFAGTASAAQTVTIGSTSGSPSDNICLSMVNCTYVPFDKGSGLGPSDVVPFDGTVTSFSVNGNAGAVKLRVLRPAGGSSFTGSGTSPPETISTPGVNTFPVAMQVKKGDVLALDNDSSALIFDNSSTTPVTNYYNPAHPDGSTAAPNNTKPDRLLMSATVQASPATISGASLTHKRFRVAKGKTAVSARSKKAPRGTSFKFTLSHPASVQIAIARLGSGRRNKSGRCVKSTAKLRAHHAKRCTLSVSVGKLTRANLATGANTVKFTGRIGSKKLRPARYAATLTATNAGGTSNAVTLRFKVVRK